MSNWKAVREDGTTRTACPYAKEYQATRRPTCGCDVCAEKWEAKLREEGAAPWRDIASYLADCHAANETTVVRARMPRYELERFVSIAEKAALFLLGEAVARPSRSLEDVIDRLRRAAASAREALKREATS